MTINEMSSVNRRIWALLACIAGALVAGVAQGGDCEQGWRPVFQDVILDHPAPQCTCDADDPEAPDLVSIPTMYAGAVVTRETSENVNRITLDDVALTTDQDLLVHVFARDVPGASVGPVSKVSYVRWGAIELDPIPGASVDVRESTSSPFRHSVWRLPAGAHSGGVETVTAGFMATSSERKIAAAIPVTRQHADLIGAVSVNTQDVPEGEPLTTTITTQHEGSLVLACNVQRSGISHIAPVEAYDLYAQHSVHFQRINGQTIERPEPGEYTHSWTPIGNGTRTSSTILIELRGSIGKHFTKCWEMSRISDLFLHDAVVFPGGAAEIPVIATAPDGLPALKLVATDTDGHSEFKVNIGQLTGRYFVGFDFHTPIESVVPGIEASFWQFVRFGRGTPVGVNHNDSLMTFLRNHACQMLFHINEIISNTSPNPLRFDETQRVVVEIQPNVPERTVLRVWIDGELIGDSVGTGFNYDATDNYTFSIRARTNDEMRGITHYVRRIVASTSFERAAYWEEPPGASVDDAVLTMAVHDGGAGDALYAGGRFGLAGGEPVGSVASWNGDAWSPLGDGMDGEVYALAEFNLDAGADASLYAGGDFSEAGGVPAASIARWDGASWSALGAGVDGVVHALAGFDDGTGPSLFVGGDFGAAGAVNADSIARWSGAAWSPVGSGVDGRVLALTVFDDGVGPALYAGGDFTHAGGATVNGVARWSGAGWSPLAGGVNGVVRAMTVYDDGSGPALYIGGDFTMAGGVAVGGVARWNGSAWSALGVGVNGAVAALAAYDDGSGPSLFVGGDFTTAGGLDAGYIARWDGVAWSPLGSGMNDPVAALATFQPVGADLAPGLYAGGFFTDSPGGDHHIAFWGACAEEPLAGDLNGDGVVNAQDLGLLLGSWGFCPPPCAADLSRNCFVGSQDLAMLLSRWGSTRDR